MKKRSGIALNIKPMNGNDYGVFLPNAKRKYVIGRNSRGARSNVDVAIADKHVSRRHCEIKWMKTFGWVVRDLNTSNGTTLDGEQIYSPTSIHEHAELLIGTTRITFRFDKPKDYIVIGDKVRDDDESAVGDETKTETTVVLDTVDGVSHPSQYMVTETLSPGGGVADAPFSARRGTPDNMPTGTVSEAPTLPVDDMATKAQRTFKSDRTKTTKIVEDFHSKTKSATRAETVVEATSALTESTVELVRKPDGMVRQDVPSEESVRPEGLGGIFLDLVNANLIDKSRALALLQVARAVGRTYFRALAEDTMVKFKDEIYQMVSKKLGLQLINDEKALFSEVINPDWLHVAVAESLGVLVLEPRSPSVVRYATIDPFDLVLDDWIRQRGQSPTEKVLTTPKSFFGVIHRLKSRVDDEMAGEIGVAINISMEEERHIRNDIENVEVPQIVNYFLHRGHAQGASDIHIEPTEDRLLIRNRVDGMLHEDTTLPSSLHSEIVSRIKIIAGMDVAEKRRPQDGRIGSVIRGSAIDVRVSTYPTVYGDKIVMRLLDKSALRPSPETLGLLAGGLRLLKDKISAPYGLIMLCGPTGSGKTTTLYSCLGSIDKTTDNVLTIEDPVEYRLKGVHQMQVNEKIGLTFASGLRTILRQDPDVIMVGECRDLETAAMAIQASLTGHIVFSTIHTNDSVGVVTRLLDMEIDPFLVANALSLAVAQRLVRCVCQHCKTTILGKEVLKDLYAGGVSDERLKSLHIEVDPEVSYVKGAGCMHCRNTGYQGRQAVFELFEMTAEARTMIMSNNFNANNLHEYAVKQGMITLIKHGMHLVDEGITTHEEVLRVLGESY